MTSRLCHNFRARQAVLDVGDTKTQNLLGQVINSFIRTPQVFNLIHLSAQRS